MTGALHALLPPALLLLLTVGAACPGADGPTGDDAGVIDHADAGAPHEGCAAATQLEVQDTEAGPAALPGDVAAGVERCDADSFNRIAAVSCLAPAGVDACDPADGETGGECAADADCARNAQCIRLSFDHCGCVAPCATDADCGAGEACVCSAGVTEGGGFLGMLGVPSCVPAACSTGADCASDRCGVGLDTCATRAVALACRDGGCASDADCPAGDACTFDPETSTWGCGAAVICD